MKKILVPFALALLVPLLVYPKKKATPKAKSSFLIQPKEAPRASKNQMKEDIGGELKKSLYACASVSNELGKVQQALAVVETRLFARVERLVDNGKEFRKARHKDLSQALATMKDIAAQLRKQEASVQKMLVQMNKNTCLKG